MKDQILKIAKVKSEKEFYKKYPSEEAFMKAHGKAFKKAAMGSKMVNDQLHQLTDFGNPPIAQVGATTPKFEFNKFGATADNPQGSFGAGAGQAGMSALQNVDKIIGGIEAIGQQKKNIKKADQSSQLSGLANQAANTREKVERKYVRPEDALVQPGQLGNPYGSGTNYLAAQNGTMIGGNPTEIQNTYAPTGDLYQDLGYEPLEETYKQYKKGGRMPKAELGEYFQDSGQAQIGSAVGESIGSAFGPAGAIVGKYAGKFLGNALGGVKDARELKKYQDQTAMNTQQAAWQNQLQSGQFSKSMEHGGYMNPEYNPQVIAKFGDYDVKDLLKPPYDADMLRSGGHLAQVGYTAPSAAAMFTGRPNMPQAEYGTQMAMGGELEVGDGGRLETMSYNPYLPGGEIGMFRGASHDNGGIKTKYGENEVEVEGGEPAVKLQDGGSSENLVVFGNIKINKEIADLMGDPKANGKKFKTYIADVAKNDAKQLKRINKGLELIDQYDGNSSYDKLGMNSGMANLMGGKAHQKINAEKIKEAGIVQDAIHQTARQLGAKSDRLAEGKIEKETDPSMVANNGMKAQNGSIVDYLKGVGKKSDFASRKILAKDMDIKNYKGTAKQNIQMLKNLNIKSNDVSVPTVNQQVSPIDYSGIPAISSQDAPSFSPIGGPSVPEFVDLTDQRGPNYAFANTSNEMTGEGETKKGFDWNKAGSIGTALLSNLEPYLRPSNANDDLPPDQLYPEYFALATNQLDPVQAQTYQPMLDTPMDISFNDQINAIDSQARAAIRAAGQNQSAQAMIMAQALEAKNQVFGNRDRINTTNKIQTFDKNRALLNDAKLKNLQILDQQYVRQAQAKSNTKQQSLAALSSIAAKTAQQRATNRKLAIMENMYGFRFSPSGRAINMNAPAQFNLSGSGAGTNQSGITTDASGNTLFPIWDPKTRKVKGYSVAQGDNTGPSLSEIDNFLNNKNGGKTPKTKTRNSSIVRALKSL